MLHVSATRNPPEMGLIRNLPTVSLRLSLAEAGILISALKADADAAFEAGDKVRCRQLQDRAADLRETAADNARRLLGSIGPKRASRGSVRA